MATIVAVAPLVNGVEDSSSALFCPNCGCELERYVDKLMCYTHDTVYCVWCAHDREGNCREEGCHATVYCPF